MGLIEDSDSINPCFAKIIGMENLDGWNLQSPTARDRTEVGRVRSLNQDSGTLSTATITSLRRIKGGVKGAL